MSPTYTRSQTTANSFSPWSAWPKRASPTCSMPSIRANPNRSTRILVALGISLVGSEVAAAIARHFGSMDKIRAATVDDLVALDSIGPKIAESVVDYFRNPSNRQVVDKLTEAGVNMEEESASDSVDGTPLDGLRFVVTGRLSSYSRSDIQARIKELGGAVSGSLSKRTDYLVAGEGGGSKLTDAERLGVAVLSEEDFERLISEQ